MKKYTLNLPGSVKYLILSRGPGETSQAIALGRYLVKRGGKVIFCLKEEKNLFFFDKNREFRVFLTKKPARLKIVLTKEKPSVFLIFNSKIWSGEPGFLERPPFKKPAVTLTLDSNWLFNAEKYPFYPPLQWADKHLVLFPQKIFELGLKKNRGAFGLDREVLEKIVPVGFIPSYQKPGKKTCRMRRAQYRIKEDEKFIFAYFSGFGAGHRIWAFNNLVGAVERLRKKGYKIKTLYIGPKENLDPRKLKKNWLLLRENLTAGEYFETLASSDLIFQHQGLATLSQGIAAQVPVIANVGILKDEKLHKLHFWELQPFGRAGVCFLLSRTAPVQEISQKIEQLLYDKEVMKKMKIRQQAVFEKGEEKVFATILNLLKSHRTSGADSGSISVKS